MISLNTYSFGLAMGLVKEAQKSMKFEEFVFFFSKKMAFILWSFQLTIFVKLKIRNLITILKF